MSASPNDQHASPPEDDCIFCCDELSEDNYVEYRAVPLGPWLPSVYCQNCIQTHFIDAGWQKYLDAIAKADCAAALKRVITAPPPENVKDAGLPCKDNGLNEEVQEFWFASSQSTVSAKLTDSLSGDAKLAFWLEKQEFLRIQEEMEAKQQADEKAKASATQPQSEQPQKSS